MSKTNPLDEAEILVEKTVNRADKVVNVGKKIVVLIFIVSLINTIAVIALLFLVLRLLREERV